MVMLHSFLMSSESRPGPSKKKKSDLIDFFQLSG